MKISQLSGPPSRELARALADFEAPFTYPLGPGNFFRISHGEDYTLFFRAQGDGACFIAEENGRVVGALGTAVRRLLMPGGTERSAAYFGDLKIAVDSRGGTVLGRLARAAGIWLRPKVEAGFGVVMRGTSRTPEAYTGRARIPGFQPLGEVMVYRLSTLGKSTKENPNRFLTTPEAGLACYRRLSRGRYACPTGNAQARSEITPIWLMSPDGTASGMLEDTRRAKRLIVGDGSEMLSSHLSCFAYSAASSGVELINVALCQAARVGLPALFVAVAEPDASEFSRPSQNLEILAGAPATIYGTGLRAGVWNINSSEI